MMNQCETDHLLLSDWLKKIEQLHPHEIELGLERIRLVAERLNLLQFSNLVITIAGTNGKGSCVAFLESILLKSGYQVAAYTSPHLIRFNERIRINGVPVKDDLLCHSFKEVFAHIKDVRLTYFEFTTLAALLIFKKANIDVMLLEVGMGGRFDAVNIIEPNISIIATVALDHQQWLGETREEIGYEKAGIFRKNRPAICGDLSIPESVLNHASEIGANLFVANQHFHYQQDKKEWQWKYKNNSYQHLPLPKLPIQNAATSLMAIHLLQDSLKIPKEAIYQGLKETFLAGRFQIVIKHKTFILDVAHNPAATSLLRYQLDAYQPDKKFHAIVAMLGDKDIYHSLKPLVEKVSVWHVCRLDVSRAASVQTIGSILLKLNVQNYTEYESVAAAIKTLMAEDELNDNILVFGSFYTVAGALQLLQNEQGSEFN